MIDRRKLLILALGASAALVPLRPAFALSLDEAKRAGLIGERPYGYLGEVKPGADPAVTKLVNDINLQRKAKYRTIASQNGIALPQVEAIAGKSLLERAKKGEYVMAPNGSWSRR